MDIKVRVEGVIFRQDDKIVLGLHQKNNKNYWVIPGGHLEAGETFEDGLKRELTEELGIEDVSVDELLYADEFIDKENKRHIVKLGFLVTAPEESFLNLSVVAENESIVGVREFTRLEIIQSEDTFFPSKDFFVSLLEAHEGGM